MVPGIQVRYFAGYLKWYPAGAYLAAAAGQCACSLAGPPALIRHQNTRPAGSLLAEIRHHFGLSQLEMAYLLGTVRPRITQAEAGTRPLPEAARTHLRALQAARKAAPAALPAPDWRPVRNRLAQCQAQALRMQFRLTYELPALLAVARARLEAVEALPEALATAQAEAPLSPGRRENQLAQLTQTRNAARDEWDARAGPAPLALLRARLAGLQAEALALADELARAGVPDAGAAPAGE